MSMNCNINKRHLLFIIPILLLALALRGILAYEMRGTPSVVNPSQMTDMATYLRLSEKISRGEFPDHYDYQPFYYTIFLPFARLFSRSGTSAAIFFQILLGTAAVGLAYLAGKMLFGERGGLLGAFILAVDRIHVFYTPFMLLEVLQSFWLALILYVVCVAHKKNRAWLWLLSSFLIAVATLTRGNAVLLYPGLLALMIWQNRRQVKKLAALILVSLLLFELPQLPFAIVNYRYTGRWCGASTAGDKVLALGNTPEAPPGGLEYPLTYTKWVAQSDLRPEEGRVSVASNILKWAWKQPLAFAELKFRSLLLFWDKQEIPNNVSLQREGMESFLTRYPILLPFSIVGTLSIMGVFALLANLKKHDERRGYHAILLYMTAVSWLGTALFYNLARFRLSALPLLCVLAGGAIAQIIDLQKESRNLPPLQKKNMIYKKVLVILVAFFLVNNAYSLYEDFLEPKIVRVARPDGVQCVFDDTTLIYDHGPLSFGGIECAIPNDNGITIEKRLSFNGIPKMSAGKAKARMLVFVLNNLNVEINVSLTHNGRTYTDFELKKERFCNWLEVELDNFDTDKPFVWTFKKGQSIGIGMDYSRNYGRTIVDGNLYPAEAAMEIEW